MTPTEELLYAVKTANRFTANMDVPRVRLRALAEFVEHAAPVLVAVLAAHADGELPASMAAEVGTWEGKI